MCVHKCKNAYSDGYVMCTLKARAMATPTMKRKKGMTKSARVHPFQGE